MLFLGLGALAFALALRPSTSIAYGRVAVAFVWEVLGALLTLGLPTRVIAGGRLNQAVPDERRAG